MEFVQRIPNGGNVNGIQALGHVNASGGGKLSVFGEAFKKAGFKWTVELCLADSDGDGRTNGEELGDPCCVWNAATKLNPADPPTFKDNVTNPSDPKDVVTAEILEQWVCGYHPVSSSSSSASSSYGSESEGANPMQPTGPGNSGGSGFPLGPKRNSTVGAQNPATPSSDASRTSVAACSGGVLVAVVLLLHSM